MTEGFTKPERPRALAIRQRILEAAREVFARHGLDAEMKDIAHQADLGVGTLYRYFVNRQGLLAALIQEAKRKLQERLKRAIETQQPESAIRDIIRAGAEACEQFGALTEAVVAGKLSTHPSGEGDITALLENLLLQGMQKGTFRRDLDVPAAVAMLKSVFSSGAFFELAAQRSYPAAADAVAELFLKSLLYESTAKPSPPDHDQRT